MDNWSEESAVKTVHQFNQLGKQEKISLLAYLNDHFPPSVYNEQVCLRRRAVENLSNNRHIIAAVTQHYPVCITQEDIAGTLSDLSGYAIMLTAGGEGERLRLSLEKQGVPASRLENFTKATYPLPGFYRDFGTLQVNLSVLSHICKKTGLSIPVIVTTGPPSSMTARVIPSIVEQYKSFGLEKLLIMPQEERLHLTNEEQIVYTVSNGKPRPVTNPDETGGPIMKLKKQPIEGTTTALAWLRNLGCTKIILLQGTALYSPALIGTIAAAGKHHDGLGVGIARSSFPENDPFGTYVLIEEHATKRLIIAEQEVRNTRTRMLQDNDNTYYLPYNTGFYSFDISLIEKNDLPDYATPPKEILPGLPRSPKIGYAATDILSFAADPAVLTINHSLYGVLKKVTDLARLSDLGKHMDLDKICRAVNGS